MAISWTARRAGLAMLLFAAATVPAVAQDAAGLAGRLTALRGELANGAFQHPLHMESTQKGDELQGDAYALVDQPYTLVSQALQGADHWCDILMLHLDVKGCQATTGPEARLKLAIARKYDQPLSSASWVDFDYEPVTRSAEYMQVRMAAEAGPMSTHNYRIVLEAMPADAKRSFIHLSFAYSSGFAARLAMEGYFATFGRNKVGFSVVGTKDGKPVYVGNVRGLIERNTMRYFLAIDAYVNAYTLPANAQQEARLKNWIAGAERYPIQLREMTAEEYFTMKKRELQGAAAPPPAKPAAREGPNY